MTTAPFSHTNQPLFMGGWPAFRRRAYVASMEAGAEGREPLRILRAGALVRSAHSLEKRGDTPHAPWQRALPSALPLREEGASLTPVRRCDASLRQRGGDNAIIR